MAKCSRCGRGGLFLKLKDGLCANCQSTVQMEREQEEIRSQTEVLKAELADQKALYEKIEADAKTSGLSLAEAEKTKIRADVERFSQELEEVKGQLAQAKEAEEKAEKNAAAATRKVQRGRELVKAIQNACDEFETAERLENIRQLAVSTDEFLTPTVTLSLQCLDMRELRKRYRQNEKNIQDTLEKYKSRYTTKANLTIYRLMVIALSAELQNVLHNLSYGKLEDALKDIQTITNKYYIIAAEGSQSIAPTIKKFIGELDYFFQEAVRIEYEYYVQKERAKEEQRAIREQMRQEAEERRELERQRKQVEKEESKFHDQISQLSAQVEQSQDDEKTKLLQARIAELQKQLEAVAEQKDKIAQLQNGKAGNVYIISNIGSFGEDVFKIGMTRRLEPQERVDELGSASVPFPFDVHSMIFSDDAVSLETQMHHILNDRRVNKVNLRKEFFRVSLDELEKLVQEICPTAEFKRTVLAEQYRQSLSIQEVRENPEASPEDEEDDIEE